MVITTHSNLVQRSGQIARPKPKRKEHLLLVAETQMGKTSMGLQMIARRHQTELEQLRQAVTRWSIVDPKRTFWLGLESVLDQDGKPCVIHPRYSQPETILTVLERLQYLVQVMEHRQDYRWRCHAKGMHPESARPRIVVLEEWITIGKIAHAFDKKYGLPKAGQPSVWQQILGLVTILLLNGLESNIGVWIFAQSPFLKSLYFDDSAIRDQFAYCCLGNPTKGYGLIEKSISSPHIIPASYRKELAEALKIFKDQELWACLTTYGGQYRLQETPWIDPAIKWTHLFYGELDLNEQENTAEDHQEQLLLSEAELPPLAPSTPNASNLIQFPDGKSGLKLSAAALKLINFARRKGCKFRLQEAQNRLGRYGKADIVLAAAKECVAVGLGVLEENPKYPNSYFFCLVSDDNENNDDDDDLENDEDTALLSEP